MRRLLRAVADWGLCLLALPLAVWMLQYGYINKSWSQPGNRDRR